MFSLEGKVALITGGGGGAGLGVAKTFLALGAKIAIAERDEARAEAARMHFANSDAVVGALDVCNAEAVATFAAELDAEFGRVDVLLNNVGDYLALRKPFETQTEAEWDALYGINLRHVFIVTRAILPLMRKGRGDRSIINFSSIEAFRGIPGCSVYAAFKAAVSGFTKSLALELAPEGIRVNDIAQETTQSLQVDIANRVKPAYREHIPRWIPLGRFGDADDVAGCAAFLASRASSWMTGATLHLDGGALAACGYYQTPQGEWTHFPVVVDNGV